MHHPAIYHWAPKLRIRDPLASLLGAADDGVLEYGFLDAVKLTGHACPTVAGAYAMTLRALAALYPDTLPERGGIRVEFRQPQDAGTTGVQAAVVQLLTGAAGEGGFKGLGGKHARRGLLTFGAAIAGDARFTRLDSGCAVEVRIDLSRIPAAPETAELLPAALAGSDAAKTQRFRTLWQQRVRRILLEGTDAVVEIRHEERGTRSA